MRLATGQLLGVVALLSAAACADVEQQSGCAVNSECAPDEYCTGDGCDGVGTCALTSTECPTDVALVCGCDGNTYDNACEAGRAGVRVASDGICACGGNGDCDAMDYCAASTCAGGGTCELRPVDCPAVIDPVCGCDGDTYDNACLAQEAGMRVESTGPCPCTNNASCDTDAYCAGDGCGMAGTCETRPVTCPTVFDPVCGCDEITYDSACNAEQAGVRVASAGPCPCDGNDACTLKEYCYDDACDVPGVCRARPAVCIADPDPVCGCDGVTYDNACLAALQGVRVESTGACPCTTNDDCETGEYCASQTCAGVGTCALRPRVCIIDGDDVCGCDGTTYNNACIAAQNGVRVRFVGMCLIIIPLP